MQDQLFETSTDRFPYHACTGDLCQRCHDEGRHTHRPTACRLCLTHEPEEAANIGKAQAASNVDPYYAHLFETALQGLLIDGLPFTADAIIAKIGLPGTGQNASNAVGALMSGAARRGIICKVGYTKSTRRESHGRVVAVWEANPK